ncbi:helix-turn-helix domain-containing protein [Streptosporangium canum]|uniref:AraC-like ligand-binding domain-containing protein n=1 Tax=Streptosporangium canum TaxID=324952 RepID=UPI0036B5CF54
MLSETVFRSDDVPPADRFERWRELVNRAHAPMDMTSDHREDFRASQRLLDLGSVSVWRTAFQSVCCRRTPKLIRQSDPEGVHLSLPTNGPLVTVRGDHEIVYDPYSLCVYDTSRPTELHAGDSSSLHAGVALEIPKALLHLPGNTLERLTTRRLSVREGFGALLAHFLTHLMKESGSYQPSDGSRLGTVAVDLVSALFAHTLDADDVLPPETRRRTLIMRIHAFIELNLVDRALTPVVIAAHHHISVRYLQILFQQQGKTVTGWIRRRRLERCREDLATPSLRAHSIRAVALRRGFATSADFSRAFRSAYGMSPSEYRHAALAGDRSAIPPVNALDTAPPMVRNNGGDICPGV